MTAIESMPSVPRRAAPVLRRGKRIGLAGARADGRLRLL
jgi:hypothetical protein